ncbi:phospholipase D-like domain-containing protein [Sinorhizobium fredii]|uniref:phospholipase D-like domain-containing protein n=1 Tax=Rhizobium fredii TaxID=380 RepID=UPI00351719AD
MTTARLDFDQTLPTGSFDSWSVTALRDSLAIELAKDKSSLSLAMFFYAVTSSGWSEIRKPVERWMRAVKARSVVAYVGTDHALTEPAAVMQMIETGLDVRLMKTYRGVFHPKVIWLAGGRQNCVWVGSNNLTRDGLLHNIEFAVLIKARESLPQLARWAQEVASGSAPASDELLASYKAERENFQRKQASANSTTFTWSKKKEPEKSKNTSVRKGDLIVEIMPEETRGGTQIQLPKQAARDFFGLNKIGDQREIELFRLGSSEIRPLIITVFANNTIRVSINDLEYGDRPCVVIFRKKSAKRISFEIVPESIYPSRYRALIEKCTRQTRTGSRRWVIQ